MPADVRMEVAFGSWQVAGDRASWRWRQTAGFLRDMDVDYIEFNVSATTEARKFKSLTIAPTPESLTKVPYSPSPTLGEAPTPGMPRTGSNPTGEVALLDLALVALGLALTGSGLVRRTHS